MKLLSQLNYVDVVAKKGSIRKAAQVLNITSTALNRRILALEEDLGAPIFERLPNGVRLNAAGELLILHIRQSMSDLNRVTSQIADLSGIRKGHITLASGAEVAGRFLPAQMARYCQGFPDVSFDIYRRDTETILQMVTNFTCDIGVVFGAIPVNQFQLVLSLNIPVMAVMRANHPLADQPRLSLQDLADYQMILPAEGSGLRDVVQAKLRRYDIHPKRIMTSESFEFMAQYCHYHDAVTFMPSLEFIEEGGGEGDLVYRALQGRDYMEGRLHIIHAKNRVLSVAAAKFIEELRQHLIKQMPDHILQ